MELMWSVQLVAVLCGAEVLLDPLPLLQPLLAARSSVSHAEVCLVQVSRTCISARGM